ncbi:MAG: pectinesterase family protein, partial [Bacteroidales bacterium]|nr:pectinesterase family protein [Bacteroidales bacterium]
MNNNIFILCRLLLAACCLLSVCAHTSAHFSLTAPVEAAIPEVQEAEKGQRSMDIVVARDGTGNFRNIQEAINSVRDFRPEGRVRIFVKNGLYKEKIIVPANKTNISLVGESVEKTIITWDDHAKIESMGTFKTYTILIQGDGFEAENITFENNAEQLGQAVAVHIEADKVQFRNCRLLGNQDTLYTGKAGARQYFADCYIEGTTDFIFGPSTVWFENCTVHSKKNSFITAASTPEDIAYGYVFNRCTLTAEEGIDKVYLGRPWRAHAAVVFMYCDVGAHILPEAWENWRNPENEKTARFSEYRNTGLGANTSDRVS